MAHFSGMPPVVSLQCRYVGRRLHYGIIIIMPSPIMQANTEQQQLNFISQLCGSVPDVWPGVEELELYKSVELPNNQKRRVKERLRPYVKDPYDCDLLDNLLTLDPKKRIDANTALNHDFFWIVPMPSDLSKMLSHHLQSI